MAIAPVWRRVQVVGEELDQEDAEREDQPVDSSMSVNGGENAERYGKQEEQQRAADEHRNRLRCGCPDVGVDVAARPRRAEASVAHDAPDELRVLDGDGAVGPELVLARPDLRVRRRGP